MKREKGKKTVEAGNYNYTVNSMILPFENIITFQSSKIHIFSLINFHFTRILYRRHSKFSTLYRRSIPCDTTSILYDSSTTTDGSTTFTYESLIED